MALKFSRLVPNIQLRGGSSVSFTSRSNPPPQLAKKNFVNVGANVENYFFFVCVIIVFFMETGSKLITVNFFQPQIHRRDGAEFVSDAQTIKIHTGKMPK